MNKVIFIGLYFLQLISLESQTVLSVKDVLKSASERIPEIGTMKAEISKAKFKYMEALGNFDIKIKAQSANEILGGYTGTNNKLLFEQPTEMGIRLFGGYRLGRGSFAVYDGKKKTNEFGELQGGVLIPILRNLGLNNFKYKLDKERIGKLLSVVINRIQKMQLQKVANKAYWNWYTAGQIYLLYSKLLELAVVRQKQIERRVELGNLPKMYLHDNERTIYERKEQVLSASQLFKTAGIYLSYFNRSQKKKMVVPGKTKLPTIIAIKNQNLNLKSEIEKVIKFSPKLVALRLKSKQKMILKDLAKNMKKPQLDLFIMASKDMGGKDIKKDAFQLDVGVQFSLPVQNRKAKGLEGVAESDIKIIRQEKKTVRDSLNNAVTTILMKMEIERKRFEILKKELDKATLVANLEKRAFFLGQSSLIFVNKREFDITKTNIRLQKAKVNYFKMFYELRILQGQ